MKQFWLFVALLAGPAAAMAQPAWQQRVNTKIDVRLDDAASFLHATEEITYTNNSHDTLGVIYMHLWPNAFRNDRTAFERQMAVNGSSRFYFSKEKDRGYIDSLQFLVDGQSVDYYTTDGTPDVARLALLNPVLPGQTITISTPFRVKIPIVFSRLGHTGQAYYISQWFPKPAVYDQLGWHTLPFLDQGEFFSEYGSYDVSITLPANYVLMATGNCTDEQENRWLDELARKPLPPEGQRNDSAIASAATMKTVHYHEDNVHDFAWFADKRWLVRKDTVRSPGNNQLVTAWSAFQPSYTKSWQNVTGYLTATVKHYGEWVGPYPYKTIKAVLGDMHAGGGMEYPTITVIDKSTKSMLKTAVIHEAGHNWFYGMLGSNERDHAWMDEGINTFYEQKTMHALDDDTLRKKKIAFDETLLYDEAAATHTDQPIDMTSANFEKTNYGIDVYYKTALCLRWLEAYMGHEAFESGMKEYYAKWRYHHPYPADLRACLQAHTTKSLDWFFDTILTTDKKIDYTITHARVNGNNTEVTVRNNSKAAAPVQVNAYKNGKQIPGIWAEPFTGSATLSLPVTDWDKLAIGSETPDAKSTNNVYRRHALFHHFGINVKPVFGLNTGDKDKLFISPALGYNQYDGIMAGLLLHDITLPENRLRFELAPLYSFETKSFTGAGSAGYIWYPGNVFSQVMLQADAKTFHDNETSFNLNSPLYGSFAKVAPSLNFVFNEHNSLSKVNRSLLLKGYYISEQNINYGVDSARPALATQQKEYGLLRYTHRNSRMYNPFSYSAEAQGGADFAKISAEGNLRIDYNVKNKSLYLRAYIGKFFAISADPAVYGRYELNATYSGVDDYLYDGTYLARNASGTTGAQQVSIQEGGFKVPVFNNAARSGNWLAAVNLATDLPLPKPFRNLPLRVFFDAGLIPNANPSFTSSSSTTLLYDGGVELALIKNVVSLYLPIVMSNDFQNYLINTYGKRNLAARSFSFTLQFQNINWLNTGKVLRSQ